MALKTNEEMAQLYQEAIEAIVGSGMSSYTLPTGQSVTKLDLANLERLFEYYKNKAKRDSYGRVNVMDLSR